MIYKIEINKFGSKYLKYKKIWRGIENKVINPSYIYLDGKSISSIEFIPYASMRGCSELTLDHRDDSEMRCFGVLNGYGKTIYHNQYDPEHSPEYYYDSYYFKYFKEKKIKFVDIQVNYINIKDIYYHHTKYPTAESIVNGETIEREWHLYNRTIIDEKSFEFLKKVYCIKD